MLRTKVQRKNLCHSCPFAKTANLLGDSIILFILKELVGSEKSFSEIEKSLHSVSSRTVTEKLKFLEENLMILRREVSGKPTRVYYSLTQKAKPFKKVASALTSFGDEFFQNP